MKKYWLMALIAIIGMFTIFGCSSSSSSDNEPAATLADYKTGDMVTLDPVGSVKTPQAATADTHEVETDGNWIVWKGRSINVSYYDGTDVTALAPEPGGSVVPWAFSYCYASPIAFDGTTIVSVANDVASADLPKFYYYVPGNGTGGDIDLPLTLVQKDLKNDYDVYVSGDWVTVGYDSDLGHLLYRANLSDAAPAFEAVVLPNVEPYGITGVYLAMPNTTDGCVDIYDISGDLNLPLTATPLDGDDSDGTVPSDFRAANGIFTWVEGDIAYYFEPGVMDNSDVIYHPVEEEDAVSALSLAVDPQHFPVAGPDYFLWNTTDIEGSSSWYLAKTDAGSDATIAPTPVAFIGDLEDIETGAGFFAYVAEDAENDDQIFVYDLSDPTDLTATVGVKVSDNGEEADEDGDLMVDGTKVYDLFDYKDADNPSRVLVMYDVATQELKDLTGDRDFQQVAVYAAAGGKAIFLHRDRHFRLFAKKAANEGVPVTLTPVSLRIDGDDCQQFALANGVVVFKAIDTSRYLDNPFLTDVCKGEMREIYYIDLDGAREIKPITVDGLAAPGKPQTDGAFVTWRDDEDYAWAYEIATGEKRIIGMADGKISVDGGIAVWEDDDTDDVAYLDLNTNEGDILEDSDPDDCPTIANGLIVWEDGNHPYYFDLNAEPLEVKDIYEEAPSEAYTVSWVSRPLTDGRFITWEESRTSWDHDGDGAEDEPTPTISATVVVAYDTETEALLTVPAADWKETYSVCSPRISDGIVLFGAVEYGVENTEEDKEIFYCDVTADTLELVKLTGKVEPDDDDDYLWDSRPRIADGLVVWRTGGSSSWDWRGRSVAAAFID
jgi:hypothetical protein